MDVKLPRRGRPPKNPVPFVPEDENPESCIPPWRREGRLVVHPVLGDGVVQGSLPYTTAPGMARVLFDADILKQHSLVMNPMLVFASSLRPPEDVS